MTPYVFVPLSLAALASSDASSLEAQATADVRIEQVAYRNARDGMELSAALAVPGGDGPHPAAVVLTVADARPMARALASEGYAVLVPVRRGFVEVEPMLRATYGDLAGDVEAAISYLAARTDVDGASIVLLAQAEDAPPAMLAASFSGVPVVLLAPPFFDGVESFRLEQRSRAARGGASPQELDALDDYVSAIVDIVRTESSPWGREYRIGLLRAGSGVRLPRSADLPSDDRRTHFLASPLWRDRLLFDPAVALRGLRTPALVLIGTEDPDVDLDAYLAAGEGALSGAETTDATLCVLSGRTRHVFSEHAVEATREWLASRASAGAGVADGRGDPAVVLPSPCLAADER